MSFLKSFWALSLLCLISLTACFKDEKPIARRDRGGVSYNKVEMGTGYEQQVYFSLQTNQAVLTLNKYDWDLGLCANAGQPYVYLNTSKSMVAWKTGYTSFAEVKDTFGKTNEKLIDYPSGTPDSLALKGLLNSGFVYMVDMGYESDATRADVLLLKASASSKYFVIESAKVDGTSYRRDTVSFDPLRKNLLFAIRSGKLTPEPADLSWELLFAQYQHVYYDPFQTYSVAGCIINTAVVTATEYRGSKSFDNVVIQDTTGAGFSSFKNAIGFDWKSYNLNSGQYLIHPEKTYLIKQATGKVYKLHFIGFYNSSGLKGTPSFEFQEL